MTNIAVVLAGVGTDEIAVAVDGAIAEIIWQAEIDGAVDTLTVTACDDPRVMQAIEEVIDDHLRENISLHVDEIINLVDEVPRTGTDG